MKTEEELVESFKSIEEYSYQFRLIYLVYKELAEIIEKNHQETLKQLIEMSNGDDFSKFKKIKRLNVTTKCNCDKCNRLKNLK